MPRPRLSRKFLNPSISRGARNWLRREPAWQAIPVVVVTARDLSEDDRLRLEGRVDRVLQKGAYIREGLLEKIRELVGGY